MPYRRVYSITLGMHPFFPFGEHFLTFEATFFSGVTYFCWRDFFYGAGKSKFKVK